MKNIKLLTLFSLTLLFAYSLPLFAQQAAKSQMDSLKNNDEFYQIDPNSLNVEYLGELDQVQPMRGVNEQPNYVTRDINTAKEAVGLLDNIVNLAKKIWDIIDDSKPVANINTMYATALPYGMRASQLSGWSSPKGYLYGFYVKNLYGIKTVEVSYRVSFQYGGNYNGTGRFLTGVTVVPESVNTLIGYSFYMTASVPDSTIVNIGTAENPVAALRLVLHWKISTIINSTESTAVYYITGDGRFQQISDPFRRSAGTRGTTDNNISFEELPPTVVSVPSPAVPDNKKSALPKNSIPAKLKKNINNVF